MVLGVASGPTREEYSSKADAAVTSCQDHPTVDK